MADELLDEALAAAAKAAKNAKRAAVLTVLAVMVAIAVLAIDNGIKRAILTEAQKAKGLLDEIQHYAEVARGGKAERTCDTCGRTFRGAECQVCKGKEAGRGGTTGAPEAGGAGGDPRAGLNGSHDVHDDAPAGAVLDTAGGAAKAPRARRAAGAKRGAPGDGG